jgi:hypothetical protein
MSISDKNGAEQLVSRHYGDETRGSQKAETTRPRTQLVEYQTKVFVKMAIQYGHFGT